MAGVGVLCKSPISIRQSPSGALGCCHTWPMCRMGVQGKSALVTHFQNSSLLHEDKRCRPILFKSDGDQAGDQDAFPMAAGTRNPRGNPQPAASTLQREPSGLPREPSSAAATAADKPPAKGTAAW